MLEDTWKKGEESIVKRFDMFVHVRGQDRLVQDVAGFHLGDGNGGSPEIAQFIRHLESFAIY